jgi:hypothetical protein
VHQSGRGKYVPSFQGVVASVYLFAFIFFFLAFATVMFSPFYNAKGELLLVHVKKMVEVRLEAG